jgi:hypothetical protein
VNGENGNLVEVTPGGAQVAGVYFVDDDTNTLNLLN